VPHVTVTRPDSGVALLTIDRPPANAMDVGLLGEIVAAVAGVAAEPPAALVLAGREGVFSAGADLKAVPGYGPEQQREMVHGINAMALGVYGLECPVVAAVTGHAIAGGMVLALCADLRVATPAGRYGLTEVKVGVPYPQAAIGVVRAELAPQAARMLAFGAELHDAQTCHRLGVLDEVHPPAAVLPRAVELAERLAAMPAAVYARTKRDLRGAALDAMRAAAAEDPLLDRWLQSPTS
jgi:enoyl-CoA hydratase